MANRQTGFSLIEALITLLVLSIGWLGLGQLQVRLSLATLDRSSAAYARLIQSTYHEKTVSYDISGIPDSLPSNEYLSTPSSRYHIQVARSTVFPLHDTTIRIVWDDAAGDTRSEEITLSLSDYPLPADTRWLLISP